MLAPALSLPAVCRPFLFHQWGAAILKGQVLRNLLKSSELTVATFLHVAACVVSVAMLLSFPAARPHHFGQHFGTTEIRQNIVRHTFVAGPEAGEEKIAQIDAQPAIPVPVTVESVAKSFFSPAIVSNLPTFRILQRFRLGPSRSGASDPLL
jgi:hypothetical protein